MTMKHEFFAVSTSNPLGRRGIVRMLDLLGRVTVLSAAVSYCWNEDQRSKERQYEAWQIVTAAHTQVASGGRIEALQDLTNDRVSLTGIDLRGAQLQGARLRSGMLYASRLDSANLRYATLAYAQLAQAHLNGTSLDSACLMGADFRQAEAHNASFRLADLRRAIFWDAKLGSDSLSRERTTLAGANLEAADLRLADLTDANLARANLRDAQLGGAVLTNAILEGADVTGANLTGALLYGTRLRGLKNWEKLGSVRDAFFIGLLDAPDGLIDQAAARGARVIDNPGIFSLTPFGQRRRFLRMSMPQPRKASPKLWDSCELGAADR
jgi:uncharacterized protein YjbI with pentapeptide repeats